MRTSKGGCHLIPACRRTDRPGNKSAVQSHNWWLVLLAGVFVMLMSAACPSWTIAASCGAPDSCVVSIDNYRPIPPPWGVVVPKYTITNVDNSCLGIGFIATDIIFNGIPWFDHTVSKYFWNGRGWEGLGGVHVYTANLDIGADYANDVTRKLWLNINSLFPHGCADLPLQEPDLTPNLDVGKPECNNQTL